jgi:hypothetical protein
MSNGVWQSSSTLLPKKNINPEKHPILKRHSSEIFVPDQNAVFTTTSRLFLHYVLNRVHEPSPHSIRYF